MSNLLRLGQLTILLSTASCGLIYNYDDYKDAKNTGGAASSSSTSTSTSSSSGKGGGGAGGSTSSSSSTGSTSSTSSTGGTGGTGGTTGNGGADAGTTSCDPGANGAPSSITLSGVNQSALYAHFITGSDYFKSVASGSNNLAPSGVKYPAQFVLTTQDGLSDSFDQSVDFYSPNLAGVTECGFPGLYTVGCSTKVARDFRCKYYPLEESDGCNGITVSFTTDGSGLSRNLPGQGDAILLASARCQ